MLVEVYARICVGVSLTPEHTQRLVRGFHRRLGLDEDVSPLDVYAALTQGLARHRQNDSPRALYETALVDYAEATEGFSCAIGGWTDGGVDPHRGFLFAGVVIDGFTVVRRDDSPASASRPTKLSKGDLTLGSDFFKRVGGEHRKALAHASKAYSRASRAIVDDVRQRTRGLATSGPKEPAWSLVEWLVSAKSL